jgi:DNA-binding MarR family transcriptional regulator
MSTTITNDTISDLRELGLASRLHRLADSLSEEAGTLYRDLGADFQPRWFPLFHLLAQASPLPITALARSLGLTHPGARQIAEQLIEAGLIREVARGRDQRERPLTLTPRGRKMHRTLAPVWAEIRAAAREMLEEVGIDLVGALERIEAIQEERSIMDRVRERMDLPPRRRLEIVPYRPAFKKHFQALHRPGRPGRTADGLPASLLLDDPNRMILRPGGSILFALRDGEVVGTCARRRHPGGEDELCLLAVTHEVRERNVDEALLREAAVRAQAEGIRALYLCAHRGRHDVLRLCRRLGFRRAHAPPFLHPEVRPSRVTLKLVLSPGVTAAQGGNPR